MWTSQNSRQTFVSWGDQVQAAPYVLALGAACIVAVYLGGWIYWPLFAGAVSVGTAMSVSSWKQREEKGGEAFAWIVVSGLLACLVVLHIYPVSGLSRNSMLMHVTGPTLASHSTLILLMNAYLKTRQSKTEVSTPES